jgi:hypothetical protein
MDDDKKFTMLYCDNGRCRVNTFEHGHNGRCPGCDRPGEPIPERSGR